jgi:hypothetical protein
MLLLITNDKGQMTTLASRGALALRPYFICANLLKLVYPVRYANNINKTANELTRHSYGSEFAHRKVHLALTYKLSNVGEALKFGFSETLAIR